MVQHGLVGQHIQLLLNLALHVGRFQRAEIAAQRALGDHPGDGLDSRRDVDQQGSKIVLVGLVAQLFNDELGECGASELHGASHQIFCPEEQHNKPIIN